MIFQLSLFHGSGPDSLSISSNCHACKPDRDEGRPSKLRAGQSLLRGLTLEALQQQLFCLSCLPCSVCMSVTATPSPAPAPTTRTRDTGKSKTKLRCKKKEESEIFAVRAASRRTRKAHTHSHAHYLPMHGYGSHADMNTSPRCLFPTCSAH